VMGRALALAEIGDVNLPTPFVDQSGASLFTFSYQGMLTKEESFVQLASSL
jgi:hypothetical protein